MSDNGDDSDGGNVYDKYGSANPVSRCLMRGFERDLDALVARAAPADIHDVGCGEGYWVRRWNKRGLRARGSDRSRRVIEQARATALKEQTSVTYDVASIYDLGASAGADLVVCCEVLEHLERPRDALAALAALPARHVLVSVPREPIWRLLNLARLAYVRDLGNTPGHVQHWSRSQLIALLAECFEIVAVRTPLPWTIALVRAR